jgi:RsiW-degrading membrane proteinase PrsW (M82 family)
MEISVLCPTCSKSLKAPVAAAGKKACCPQCKGIVLIPQPKSANPSLDDDLWGAPTPVALPLPKGNSPPPNKIEAPRKPTVSATSSTAAKSASMKSAPATGAAVRSPVASGTVEPGTVALGAATFDAPPPRADSSPAGTPRGAAPGSTYHIPAHPIAPTPRRQLLSAGGTKSRVLPWLFSLTLIPLLIITFDNTSDIKERVAKTLQAHPEVAERLESLKSEEEIFSILPEHRIEGALLARDSWMHWLFAFAAAGVFLGLIYKLFDLGTVQLRQLAVIGAVTATVGVLNLVIFQWMASVAQHVSVGGGIVGIVFLVVKFIGFSYQAALDPNNGFALSFIGFTCGVGLCEEMTKGIPVLVYILQERRMNWRGACALGLASGAGFGIAEGILYSGRTYNGILEGDIYLVRFISCVSLHAVWCAAVAIMLFHRRGEIQDCDGLKDWFIVIVKAQAVPMLLHGLYDTLLKRQMNAYALGISVLSFVWLMVVMEWCRAREGARAPAAQRA